MLLKSILKGCSFCFLIFAIVAALIYVVYRNAEKGVPVQSEQEAAALVTKRFNAKRASAYLVKLGPKSYVYMAEYAEAK